MLLLPEFCTNHKSKIDNEQSFSLVIDTNTSKKEEKPLLDQTSSIMTMENKELSGVSLVNIVEFEKPGLFVHNLSANWYQSEVRIRFYFKAPE